MSLSQYCYTSKKKTIKIRWKQTGDCWNHQFGMFSFVSESLTDVCCRVVWTVHPPGHQGLKSSTSSASGFSSSLCVTLKVYSPMGASAGGVMVSFKMPCSGTELRWSSNFHTAFADGERCAVSGIPKNEVVPWSSCPKEKRNVRIRTVHSKH